MRLALFLCSLFWVSCAAAQTSALLVGAPNSTYRRLSVSLGDHPTVWDLTVLRTAAGYQGIAGVRRGLKLAKHFSISPGIYAVLGDERMLFGSGLGLGWSGEWGRFGTEGLAMQYINPSEKTLRRFTIGEGEISMRLARGFRLIGGGEIVHNSPETEKKIFWGGGIAYWLKRVSGRWTLFTRTRGREVQMGLAWGPPDH